MHLPFASFFPEPESESLRRKRLNKKNPYGLPAGDYLIHDLYPQDPTSGSHLFLNVERVKTRELILIARFDLHQRDIYLSPRHLQSPDAPAAFELLREMVDSDTQMAENLSERMAIIFRYHQELMQHFVDQHPEEAIETYMLFSALAAEQNNNLLKHLLEVVTWPEPLNAFNNLVPFQKPRNKSKTVAKAKKTTAQSGSLIVRVDLLDAPIKIWRRLQIPAKMTLTQFHEVLQIAMGWQQAHLWQFMDPENRFYASAQSPLMEDDDDLLNADHFQLGELLRQPKDRIGYEYDLGDGWLHKIQLESRTDEQLPVKVLKAKNACPPEDCGGVWGYADILEILKKKRKSKADKEILEWLDEDFEPEAYDLDHVNQQLSIIFKAH